MACLTYKPSVVKYEKTQYKRSELITSKQILMNYCLEQLQHLDLGQIDHLVDRGDQD